MAYVSFDDPGLLAAMRTFVEATAALEGAQLDADVLDRSEAKALAGLNLRKHLVQLGWTAPTSQRTTT